jgi:hypothetical protein
MKERLSVEQLTMQRLGASSCDIRQSWQKLFWRIKVGGHTLSKTRLFWGGTFALAMATTALAAEPKLLAKIDATQAYVEAEYQGDFVELNEKLLASFVRLIGTSPYVANVTQLAQTAPKVESTTANSRVVFTERSLLVKMVGREIMPESLFLVAQRQTECTTSDITCRPRTLFQVSGPIRAYQDVVQLGNPLSLNGAYTLDVALDPGLTLVPTPGGQPTAKTAKLSLRLTLVNAGYLKFFRGLHERGVLASVPDDQQIKTGFVIWANRLVTDFNRQLVQ